MGDRVLPQYAYHNMSWDCFPVAVPATLAGLK
jgi:hypothetical protein